MTVRTTAADAFAEHFRERLQLSRKSGQELFEAPGVIALRGSSPELLDGRALVTDDRAVEVLRDALPTLSARVVNVFDAAPRCAAVVAEAGQCRAQRATAMVRPDLDVGSSADLPDALELHVVPQTPTGAGGGGVHLEEAARVALFSGPEAAPAADVAGLVAYLRSVPGAHYLAATDREGAVRATAAAAVFGRSASVFFVNTDPGWRRRGVGTAMTAAALRAAARNGAECALLDASELGRPIYLRLGFQVASETTLFVRDD